VQPLTLPSQNDCAHKEHHLVYVVTLQSLERRLPVRLLMNLIGRMAVWRVNFLKSRRP